MNLEFKLLARTKETIQKALSCICAKSVLCMYVCTSTYIYTPLSLLVCVCVGRVLQFKNLTCFQSQSNGVIKNKKRKRKVSWGRRLRKMLIREEQRN